MLLGHSIHISSSSVFHGRPEIVLKFNTVVEHGQKIAYADLELNWSYYSLLTSAVSDVRLLPRHVESRLYVTVC